MSENNGTNIEYLSYLDEHGALLQPLQTPLQNRETLTQLYRTLVTSRLFDETIINLQRVGIIGTYASNRGQEAIGTAIGKAMLKDDVFIPYYRDICAQIQRGVQLEEILQYWGGDERGSHFKHQAHDFPLCVPIATQLCHAIGVAFALKYKSTSKVAVVTCGDGATSKGDFYESLNIAGAMSLPTLFIVNNNQWAISVPLAQQTASKTLAHKALAVGIDAIRVDGNDVLGMLISIENALEKIRTNQRPFFIEAITYRICDHTTADDATRYINPALFEEAQHKEPLIRFKNYLTEQHSWTTDEDQQLYAAAQKQINIAVANYKQLPAQPAGEFFDHMYEKIPADLAEQKQRFLLALKHHE
ncbi:pyruvate dehydrogenase (acetyl-transferring) E1 component subunit alpha [Cycloclasticus pugetii]|jgi:2-oxoisovalerate dehydrogenase E1 component alpha subunit|uniref:pyruvate dehydrogenase (acetyl-transferring) E1 component subunit alpha n=1 Tax=Cycloclasticus pugetii TaxID=34068 RepID=UPI0039E631A4